MYIYRGIGIYVYIRICIYPYIPFASQFRKACGDYICIGTYIYIYIYIYIRITTPPFVPSFERPVVTKASVAAMKVLAASQGRGHVWLVGAYVRHSIPLLENGVKSAIEVRGIDR